MKTIKICGREYNLKSESKHSGGAFETYGDTGKGSIVVGSKFVDNTYRFEVLLHEVIETILTQDKQRWERNAYDSDDVFLFSFDHNYFTTLPDKIIDALLSCNAIKINNMDKVLGIKK